MKESELAYAAGILDGEGCIVISSSYARGSKNKSHALAIGIRMTNLEVLEWLQSRFRGTVSKVKRHSGFKNAKVCWQWQLRTIQAYDFLCLVVPYLIIKKNQARLAIEFQEVKVNYHTLLPKAEVEKREEFKVKIALFNQNLENKVDYTYAIV